MKNSDKIEFELEHLGGQYGDCLSMPISDGCSLRVAGAKLWGGGTIKKTWKIEMTYQDLKEAMKHFERKKK